MAKSKGRRRRGTGSVYRRGAIWWALVRRPTQTLRWSLDTDEKTTALQRLEDWHADQRAGRAPEPVPAPASTPPTVMYEDLRRDLVTYYEVERLRTARDLPRTLAPLDRRFGNTAAARITTTAIRRYVIDRRAEHWTDRWGRPQVGVADATIAKELGMLKRMFRLALGDDDCPLTRMPTITLPTLDNARQGFLAHEDLPRFLAALPTHLRPVAEFLYFSGWRKSEVLGLEWRFVDLKRGVVTLPATATKTKQSRTIAFSTDDALGRILHAQAGLRRLDCRYVFHRNRRQIRNPYAAWRKAAIAIGRPGLLIHDFRRSAARNLIEAGVDQTTAMARLGHKTPAMFTRYQIVDEANQREAGRKLDALFVGPQIRPQQKT